MRSFPGLLLASSLLAGSVADAQVSGDILVRRTSTAFVAAEGRAEGGAPAPGLTEPEPIRMTVPDYPGPARDAGQEGRVVVCFIVDAEGRVRAPAVRESSAAVFEAPVLAAIRSSRFRPARNAREPIRSTACRTYRFMLR